MWHAHQLLKAAQNKVGDFADDSSMVCLYFKPSWRLMNASRPLPSSAVPCMDGGGLRPVHLSGRCNQSAISQNGRSPGAGTCKEHAGQILESAGMCRFERRFAKLVRRSDQGKLEDPAEHERAIQQRKHLRQQPGGVQHCRSQVPPGRGDAIPSRVSLREIRWNPCAV